MTRAILPAILVASLAASASAETPLSAAEFEAHTEGRTLFFYSQGKAYGAERYEKDRKVTWTFLDGECREGHWYPQGELICFVYEGENDPQCWTFYAQGGGLRALFEDRAGATELYEAGQSDEEMICHGPRIGV